jgi:magnesium chelatase family protein
MDLLVAVERPTEQELRAPRVASSAEVRERVAEARERQRDRLRGEHAGCNGELDGRMVSRYVQLEATAQDVLARAYATGTLSARGRHRVLRTARTLADLNRRDRVTADDLLTALSLRQRVSPEEALAA